MDAWKKKAAEQADLRNKALYSFAEKLVTLSTGALALSITLRRSYSQTKPIHPELLRWCWAAFIAVILAATLVQFWRVHFHQELASAAAKASADQNFIGIEPAWWFTLSKWVMLLAFPAAILLLVAY